MARSLSLAAYRALSSRKAQNRLGNRIPRPEGDLLWMHATSHGRLAAMQDVARRMKAQRETAHALVTTSDFTLTEDELVPRGADWVVSLGDDTASWAEAFLAHWQPDLCVWTGGHFRPNILAQTHEVGIPMILVDAEDRDIRASSGRWIPNLATQNLNVFERIFASGTETAQKLIRRGTPMERVEVTAPLQISANPPKVNEDEVDEVAAMLSGRQIWLAAHVQPEELDTVLSAHSKAARLWHRLLLVLAPGPGVRADEMASLLERRGLRFVNWDDGEDPDAFCQVILTEPENGMGLWYRLAPVSFMGSSLVPGFGGSNPFDAASLGSAVLYGPNIREHLTAYSRLAGAGAARIVKDAKGLGAGVGRLIAPDQAATMALAAWEVVSEGAEITDQLLDLVHDYLDRKANP